MTERALIFLTNPEPEVFILNVSDKGGHQRVELTVDQLKGLARDSVNYLTRADQCQR